MLSISFLALSHALRNDFSNRLYKNLDTDLEQNRRYRGFVKKSLYLASKTNKSPRQRTNYPVLHLGLFDYNVFAQNRSMPLTIRSSQLHYVLCRQLFTPIRINARRSFASASISSRASSFAAQYGIEPLLLHAERAPNRCPLPIQMLSQSNWLRYRSLASMPPIQAARLLCPSARTTDASPAPTADT